jgi:hypothetical protein
MDGEKASRGENTKRGEERFIIMKDTRKDMLGVTACAHRM